MHIRQRQRYASLQPYDDTDKGKFRQEYFPLSFFPAAASIVRLPQTGLGGGILLRTLSIH